MRTKQDKDWDTHEKSIEQLHNDSILWKSEINFIQDEIKFLEHLLSSKYIDFLAGGLYKKIEVPVFKISNKKTTGATLIKIINEQEAVLSKLIDNDTATSNKNYLETHKKIQKEVSQYSNKFKTIKGTIFNIVEDVIRKKDQKKLIS